MPEEKKPSDIIKASVIARDVGVHRATVKRVFDGENRNKSTKEKIFQAVKKYIPSIKYEELFCFTY